MGCGVWGVGCALGISSAAPHTHCSQKEKALHIAAQAQAQQVSETAQAWAALGGSADLTTALDRTQLTDICEMFGLKLPMDQLLSAEGTLDFDVCEWE